MKMKKRRIWSDKNEYLLACFLQRNKEKCPVKEVKCFVGINGLNGSKEKVSTTLINGVINVAK